MKFGVLNLNSKRQKWWMSQAAANNYGFIMWYIEWGAKGGIAFVTQ